MKKSRNRFGIFADGSGTTLYDMQGATATKYETAFVGGTVTVQDFVPGDCNGDGNISIMDVTVLLTAISGVIEPQPFGAFDVFTDGNISILDVTQLLTLLSQQ